ncbi:MULTISPECIES: hypothetical protein [Thermosipho]|uniref:Mid2-like cell wall stress sensor domain protein n=1 Tax=Thermosipho affectus TaxID=660294 RepID=A0ABX3IGC7_9BACT|nr:MULTISPECIES: hypothetical protein [Thermosipho]ANQ54018.1 hypothetical protein Y592_06340 [Thermosipho sp. 1070]APT72463.1 hypothetical protein BG95_06265 [Thermosipho sp. 1063]MBT1248161.1 hypothetical protein [Thermosipho sp. 1244]ONN26886.1 hypothetical protein XJ44_06220 [Thermosipho affectus]OOC42643.1 hypothetical protein XO08_06115 [Thermosipho sp. 1074]
MKFVSNIFFVLSIGLFIISAVFFEISLRYMRRQNEKKKKESANLGIKFLVFGGIVFVISGIFAFFA